MLRPAAAALLVLLALGTSAPAVHGSPAEPAHGAAAVEAGHGAGHGDAAASEAGHAEEHHGPPWAAILVNFAIFVSVLAFFLGRPAKAFFRERAASIVSSLTAAERAQAEAQAKLAEVEARLVEVQQQAEGILQDATRQAESERERILAAATSDAQRILGQAEARVGELEGAARRRLRVLAADLAVEAAAELVERNIKPEDRSRALERNLKALQSKGA